MGERVMIFIDGSNLYHSLKNHFGRMDLDIGKFCQKLLRRRQLVRIYYYNAKVGQKQEPELYKQQQAFFASINAIPYTELRLGRLVYTNWPSVPPYEKGTDVQLATDMITHSYKGNYEVAILVAGDNDFAGAVQAVKDNGKHVEVALFGKEGTSHQLREVADRVIPINARVLKDCWKQA
ncbi:MAG: NYN domain-containing protein [Chloroflexota bacterium]